MQFGPLSPQSSRTLLRLRETRSRSRDNVDRDVGDGEPRRDNDDDIVSNDADSAIVPRRRFRKRRRNSDPSSNRPLVMRHRDGPVESARSSSPSEDEIEVLPDRFDSQGRPLDRRRPADTSGEWTERHGDFAYRSPRPGGPQVQGSWGVAGTDPEHVERMVRDVSGVLAGEVPRGVGGWLGLAGRLLGGVMAPPPGAGEVEDEDVNDQRGGDHRRRGDGGYLRGAREERRVVGYGDGGSENSRDERGKGRRRLDDHGYGDDEEGNVYDDEDREDAKRRRRRRRRRREADEWW